MKVIGIQVSNCVGYIISSQSRKKKFLQREISHVKKENRRIQYRYKNYMYQQIEKTFFN